MLLLLLLLLQFSGGATANFFTTNISTNYNNRTSAAAASVTPAVPAVIVFGDSIVDPGNNNILATIVKADFPPYGKDFPGHTPTGRFSNGRIPSDLIASALGVKDLLPTYLASTELSPEELLTGVSFASGGAGFDPLTPLLVSVLSMPEQLNLFREYKGRVSAIAGEEQAAAILRGSIYIVCAGTDDLANTYFGTPLRKPAFNVPSYVDFLVSSATGFVHSLCEEGARKVAFVGLPPVGCLPSQRTVAGGETRRCSEPRNEAARIYNSRVKEKVELLSSTSSEGGGCGKVMYLDIYSEMMEMMERPWEYGFEESTKGCCGTGEIEVSVLCNSGASAGEVLCDDDQEYVFWDSYHPTERAYRVLVDQLYHKYIKLLI